MWIEILLFCAMMAFTGAGVLAYFFESLSAPGIFFIMAAIAAVYFFKLDFRAVIDAAYWVALLSVPYVIAALAWGVAKWYLMIKARFVDVKSKLDDGRKLTEEEIGRELDRARPRARDHKDEIIGWMLYWPLSLVGTILTQTFEVLYNAVATRLDEISKRMFIEER